MSSSQEFEVSGVFNEAVLREGRMIGADETPVDMVGRIVGALDEKEHTFDVVNTDFGAHLESLLLNGEVVMSTPILTNAGRWTEKPLSACTMPVTRLGQEIELVRQEIIDLHEQGMGTGFNLDDVAQPVETLKALNAIAIESAQSGNEDRPVGNMAILSVYHPQIVQFIKAKIDAPANGDVWKFNNSVNLDAAFMSAVNQGDAIFLADGSQVSAKNLFDQICQSAYICADPGLVFMDRMNERNPLPSLGEYKVTAPCAEVGLIPGEVCQFGYINLGAFVRQDAAGRPIVDTGEIESAARTMLRALDNALEVSIDNSPSLQSREVTEMKRKVGVGLCGVADALSRAGYAYGSDVGRQFVADMLALINFATKEETVRLAEERGSFGAMKSGVAGNRHLEDEGLIGRLYGGKPSSFVSGEDWHAISRHISKTGIMRNSTTVALPPTGRSARVINASTGIEPHFKTADANAETLAAIVRNIARIKREGIGASGERAAMNEYLADASAIAPSDHLQMLGSLQAFTDESISKTINMPADSTPEDISAIYADAHSLGVSGITIYRDGTHGDIQPVSLKEGERK